MTVFNPFNNKSDTTLLQKFVIEEPEIYLQKYEYIGQGVASISTDDVTLTPAVSPSFTIDELISTVAFNGLVVANSKVIEFKVSD